MKKIPTRIDQLLPNDRVENESKCSDSIARLSSPFSCWECREEIYCQMRKKLKTYADLSREDRIEKLIQDLHDLDIMESINHQDYKAVLKKMLKFDIASLEREFKQRQITKIPCVTDTFSTPNGLKKIIVNGTQNEIGNKIGNFIFNEKNFKSNNLFDTDCVTLTKWVCLIFETIDGKPLKYGSMKGYLGEGRKIAQNEE